MTAAPLPKPDPEPSAAEDRAQTGSDADGWALLEALRRRLDDQAAQGRKTQVQVGQLADSIAALVAEQRRRSKWLNLNSFVAYVIFTVVVGAGFYALYRSRASELLTARDAARRDHDIAAQRADDATTKLAARDKADAAAWEAYQLLEQGKRNEAAAILAGLGAQPLSRTERAVLAARAHETQVMEVDAALKAAAAAFKTGRYADVVAPLEAALVGEPTGARAGAMHYYLGVAYAKGNDLAKATTHLQQAVGADTEHDDVRFQLASALDRSGQYAKARAEYDQFATGHPQSSLAVFAMRRSATLARMPATAKPPVGAPTTNGAGIAPAPTKAPAPTDGAAPAKSTAPTTAPAKGPAPAPATGPGPTTNPGPTGSAPTGAAPTKAPAPKPVAPKPVEPPSEDAATIAPMSTDVVALSEEKPARDRAPTELSPAPRAGTPAPSLPSFPIERVPTPTPEPPIDRDPAPSPRMPPRAETTPPHER